MSVDIVTENRRTYDREIISMSSSVCLWLEVDHAVERSGSALGSFVMPLNLSAKEGRDWSADMSTSTVAAMYDFSDSE